MSREEKKKQKKNNVREHERAFRGGRNHLNNHFVASQSKSYTRILFSFFFLNNNVYHREWPKENLDTFS